MNIVQDIKNILQRLKDLEDNNYFREKYKAVTFTNSWVNYAAGFATATYIKDKNGFVHLKGTVKSGTVSTSMFNLPVGYRPLEQLIFTIVNNGAFGRVDVLANGDVVLQGGSNLFVALDNIVFLSEQ